MTEQELVDGLLAQIDWAVKHNRSREEIAWIVSTLQAFLSRQLDKEMTDAIWSGFVKEIETRQQGRK